MTKRRSRAKQSPTDRIRRLREGCCPIHNMILYPMPLASEDDDKPPTCWISACGRKDCEFWVYAYDPLGAGPWDVPAKFSYLLAPDFANPNEVVRIEPSEKRKQEQAELRARLAKIDRLTRVDPQMISRC